MPERIFIVDHQPQQPDLAILGPPPEPDRAEELLAKLEGRVPLLSIVRSEGVNELLRRLLLRSDEFDAGSATLA